MGNNHLGDSPLKYGSCRQSRQFPKRKFEGKYYSFAVPGLAVLQVSLAVLHHLCASNVGIPTFINIGPSRHCLGLSISVFVPWYCLGLFTIRVSSSASSSASLPHLFEPHSALEDSPVGEMQLEQGGGLIMLFLGSRCNLSC